MSNSSNHISLCIGSIYLKGNESVSESNQINHKSLSESTLNPQVY
jgi:hypothetical protein